MLPLEALKNGIQASNTVDSGCLELGYHPPMVSHCQSLDPQTGTPLEALFAAIVRGQTEVSIPVSVRCCSFSRRRKMCFEKNSLGN